MHDSGVMWSPQRAAGKKQRELSCVSIICSVVHIWADDVCLPGRAGVTLPPPEPTTTGQRQRGILEQREDSLMEFSW